MFLINPMESYLNLVCQSNRKADSVSSLSHLQHVKDLSTTLFWLGHVFTAGQHTSGNKSTWTYEAKRLPQASTVFIHTEHTAHIHSSRAVWLAIGLHAPLGSGQQTTYTILTWWKTASLFSHAAFWYLCFLETMSLNSDQVNKTSSCTKSRIIKLKRLKKQI